MKFASAWALAFLVISTSRIPGAPPASDVPTFSLRARVVQIAGKAPDHQSFGIHLGSASSVMSGSGWSDWLSFDLKQVERTLKEYPAIYLKSWPVVVHLEVGGILDPTAVEAELKLDGTDKAILLKGELFGPSLGIIVSREGADNHPIAATMAEYNRRYWKVLQGMQLPARQRPRMFPLIDRFIGGDDDRNDWREGIENLSSVGFTAIMAPPSKPILGLLRQADVTRTAWAVYSPPGYTFADPITPGDKPFQDPNAWAAAQAKPYRDAGCDPHQMAEFAMSDEPGWYYPAAFKMLESPVATSRFHDYLKSQGLTPADLGSTDWNSVKPAGRSDVKDPASRRRFYWTMRFFPWDSARYFSGCTHALQRAFYPGIPITTNFNFFSGRLFVPGAVANNADRTSPDAAMGGHDWLEFGRMRGSTMLWTEDWFADAQAYQWSFYAAKLRCAAEKGGVTFGGYVVPRAAGDREDGILQKTLCLVGSGAKSISTFVFGPEYNFPGNCYSEQPQRLRQLAEAFKLIGASEGVLWPGRRPRPRVAILSPRSSEMWDTIVAGTTPISDATNTNLNASTVDYEAETFDLYLALQHANIPVDFVEEDDLSPAGLAAYRVVFVTEPDVPAENQKGLADWVRNGGTLVTISGAARGDRYGMPCDTISDLEAVHEKPRERLLVANVMSLKSVGTINGGAAFAIGARGMLNHPEGVIIANFDDDSPAIVRTHAGKGVSFHFAWLAGISYAHSATYSAGKLPAGFSKVIREWITAPVREAGVAVPLTASSPMVETPLLLSEAGAAITLLNWSNEPIEKLSIKVHLPFVVRSAQHDCKELRFENAPDGVHFDLPLHAADIVTLRP